MGFTSNFRDGISPSQGTTDLSDVRFSFLNSRRTFTNVRTRAGSHRDEGHVGQQADFITLVSLICNIYREFGNDLVPLKQFHPDAERREDHGHTCVVSQRAVLITSASNVTRGETHALAEDIVVKRTKESIHRPNSSGLRSLLNELRIRTHPPVRDHPNVSKFKGIAWDFEDDEAARPRPLLLEELAPQRSLERFWKDYDLVRMAFMAKTDLCVDIANGLAVLHSCGVVHGDIKPANILIFPKIGHRNAFMAKRTDFGHSTSRSEGLKTLPAFTPQWCAPEILQENHRLSFEDMIATDVYSYGLVVLSIVLGRPYYRDLQDYESLRRDGTMFERAMNLVENEDRASQDSDFELDTIRLLLSKTIQSRSSKRSLSRCLRILRRYKLVQDGPVSQTIDKQFGATTRVECVSNATWELSVSFFSGFGVDQDFSESTRWLQSAVDHGILADEEFSDRLLQAMATGCHEASGTAGTSEPQHALDLHLQAPLQALPSNITVHRSRQELERAAVSSGDYSLEDHTGNGNGEFLVSDEASDDDDFLKGVGLGKLTADVIALLRTEDMRSLSELIASNPNIVSYQDEQGNTLLLIAAKASCFEAMQLLLGHPSTDCSICNRSKESVLHNLSGFQEDEVKWLANRLMARNIDLGRETMPLQVGGSLLSVSAKIRCCPLLRSILNDNMVLSQSLLDETHKMRDVKECCVCEGGSRLRRIVAIAVSTFRSQSLAVILDHLGTFKAGEDYKLHDVQVWADRKLIPLWKVPFHSVVVKSIDLPENYFRAISHGKYYAATLEYMVKFLLGPGSDFKSRLYGMLQQAVLVDSLRSVDVILREGKRRGLPPSWWLSATGWDLWQNPLILAVQIGLRAVFERLWHSTPGLPKGFVHIVEKYTTPISKLFLGKRVSYVREIPINLVHICLSLAVTAAHRDSFFLEFLLTHTDRGCIIRQPMPFDQDFSGGLNTCFLAQAILSSDYGAAKSLLQRFPETQAHRIYDGIYSTEYFSFEVSPPYGQSNIVDDIITKSFTPLASYIRRLQTPSGIFTNSLWYIYESLTGQYRGLARPTLPEFLLLVGVKEARETVQRSGCTVV
ncbi:ankyrin [Apiospora hydei]|uniref:Ankyrin n=1 Tax=Apiospora hydei TaxID=1337664 RepID=A0ABR1XAU5_9PEZI